MKTFLIGLALAGAAAAAEPGSFHAATTAAAPPHPALYSFADLYRLAVSGSGGLPALDAAAQAPIRVAAPQSQPAEPRFSVAPVPQPDKWLLLLAGLALAGWVAHRRLARTF
jgi:hypothetical protein